MSNMKKKTTDSIHEVEELLKAAQDDMLLKLSLNSHMARSASSSQPPPSSSFIDPDLDRRFETLKSSKPKSSLSGISTKVTIDSEKKNPEKFVNNGVESDDLFARFAALKTSLPSYSSSSSSSSSSSCVGANDQLQQQQQLKGGEGSVSNNEEDEVEKLIKWAIDAARLDPSPPSDIEDNDDCHDEVDSDDEDDDKMVAGKKSKRK